MGAHDDNPDLADVQRHFEIFAAEYAHLGLYSALCRGAATDGAVASLLLSARPGQVRTVLWLAAVHDLVLRRPELPAARWYPSVVGRDNVPRGDPWPDVRSTVLDHADELRAVIGSRTTQTNEVNRSVYIAAALSLATADHPDLPVTLVEMGASAGLLLELDSYRIGLRSPGRVIWSGNERSTVVCTGDDRSTQPLTGLDLPTIAGRRGLDLHPVDLADDDRVRWLEACLWPDVPGRVERFRAALTRARTASPVVDEGDMVDDLHDTITRALDDADTQESHLVVFSSWALSYVERSRRAHVAGVLASFADRGMPVSWLTAEPPGCVPGVPVPADLRVDGAGTVIGARRWRNSNERPAVAWGTCHPHGEWIELFPQVPDA